MSLPTKADGDELTASDWNAIKVEALQRDGTVDSEALQTFLEGIVTPTISSGSGIMTVPDGISTFATLDLAEILENKTLLLPQIAQIFNTGIVTLPTDTTTLVGTDTTDDLTNKTIGINNDVTAGKLKVTGGVVEVTSSPIPANNMVLMATGPGAAQFKVLPPQTVTGASNIGTGSEGVFSALVGQTLQFKTLAGTGGITISSNATTITINGSGGGGGGGSLTVEEVGGGVSAADVATLQFDDAAGFSVTEVSAGIAKVSFTGTGGFIGSANSDLTMNRFSIRNTRAIEFGSSGTTAFIDNGNPVVDTNEDLRLGVRGGAGTDLRAIFLTTEGDNILEIREAGPSVRTGHMWVDGISSSTGAIRLNNHTDDVLTDDTIRVQTGTINLSGAGAYGALYMKNNLLYFRAPGNATPTLVGSGGGGGGSGFTNPATTDLVMERFSITNTRSIKFNSTGTSNIDNGTPGVATGSDLVLYVSGNPNTSLRQIAAAVEGINIVEIKEAGLVEQRGHIWLGGGSDMNGALRFNNHSTDIQTNNTVQTTSGSGTLSGANAFGGLYMKNNHLYFRAPNNGVVYQLTPAVGGTTDGTYTNTTITVFNGRITSISGGSGGGGGDNLGNHTATTNLNMNSKSIYNFGDLGSISLGASSFALPYLTKAPGTGDLLINTGAQWRFGAVAFRLPTTSNSGPANGDLWFDGSELRMRIGSTTYRFNKTAG